MVRHDKWEKTRILSNHGTVSLHGVVHLTNLIEHKGAFHGYSMDSTSSNKSAPRLRAV